MADISDTLAALSEAATQGEWETDTLNSEGSYGSGDDIHECFATTAIYDASGKVLFDALNSDACLVHEEWDEEDGYCHASDLTSAANAAFIVALVSAYRTGQLVPVPSVEWQPIKTAPKDGTAVLLGYFHENLDGSIYQEGGEPIVAGWVPQRGTNEREANWVARSGRLLSGDQAFAPTHWQPLPQPPQQL